MSVPVVAIVGRPNVGKSSLLNRIAGERVAIVAPVAGVTRDRVSVEIERDGRSFEIVDTGGIGVVDSDHLEASIEEQIGFAIDSADVIVLLVDVREGRTPLDEDIARTLRRQGKPILLTANKADSPKLEMAASDFCALGVGDPIPVSATEGLNTEELLDRIRVNLPEETGEGAKPVMRIAIVGKRNAGKSTLINTLAGAPRVIVSEIPGTTRDAVDVRFEADGLTFVAIDTAGLRRTERVNDPVEFYSQRRTVGAIRRSDVVLFLVDATTEISQVDKKIAVLVDDHCKPCILGINKWDRVEGATPADYQRYVRHHLPLLGFAPISFLSAKENFHVRETIRLAQQLFDQAGTRVPTADVNRALADAIQRRRPSPKSSRVGKILYGTQASVRPPTIVVFVNEPRLFNREYRRFLKNYLRDVFPFGEIPIRIRFRKREKVILPGA
jgi:GTP-binding protein